MPRLLSDIFVSGIKRDVNGFIIGLDPIAGNTPFGFYELDPEFRKDANKMCTFVAQRLGINGTNNQMTKITELTVYAAFEEAVSTYGNMIYQYKIRDNYINFEGTPTAPFINNDTSGMVSDLTNPINWSKTLSASLLPNLGNFASIGQFSYQNTWLISASLNQFNNPSIKYTKDYTFTVQGITGSMPGPSGSIVTSSAVLDMSQLVRNQFNFLGGPTISFTPQSGSSSYYQIGSGSNYIYFFVNSTFTDTLTGSNSNGVIETVYYQDVLNNGFNNRVLNNSLYNLVYLAEDYAREVDLNGNNNVPQYSGSIQIIPGVQNYDLTAWANKYANLTPGDSIQIRKVYFESLPAIVRYFDPFVDTGFDYANLQDMFGFGASSPSVQYQLWPLNFDIARLQAIEMSDTVRRSNYSFRLTNNVLKIFPVPNFSDTNFLNNNYLWIEYVKDSDRQKVVRKQYDETQFLISDVSNVPYTNPIYSNINPVGRQWIYKFTLAICQEIEATIRETFVGSQQVDLVPLPSGKDLITIAKEEKTRLLTELEKLLEETSRRAQLERKQQEADRLTATQNRIPMLIYIG